MVATAPARPELCETVPDLLLVGKGDQAIGFAPRNIQGACRFWIVRR